MTTPLPAEDPLDVLNAVVADVLSDTDAAVQYVANDTAASLNRAYERAGWQRRTTPTEVRAFFEGFHPGPDGGELIRVPRDVYSFDETFGRPEDPYV